MSYKTILATSLFLFASTHAYSADNESMSSSKWYAGISTGVVNVGGNAVVDNGYSNRAFDIDTSDDPLTLKVGYVTESQNRIEVYYKDDSVGFEDDSIDIETSSFGINYQWGISSLASEKMIPYLRVGGGLGSATTEGESDLTMAEFDMGAGVHYDMTDNLGLSAGVYRRAIAVADDYDNTLAAAMNGAELGINFYTY